ncbi:conserved unknown protein [Ectocarpus siliculosus]|uniref:Coiled-coil domain-containing protein 12 n=1 Tax=Ectocarpus siliculosus TaxID=2880 RepID=D8LKM1_ECTSI|nr:conserved unknown protein [Ectocarpus siliculosus]|eukprot:CBN74611.1 conserved unknown protein [Ectocarpus siliculosus]
MSESGAERRSRLKALKEKANKSIKFRNYRPQDAAIRQQALDSSKAGEPTSGSGSGGANKGEGAASPSGKSMGGGRKEGEEEPEEEQEEKRKAPESSLIQQELKKQKETQDEGELNIAPKKANWDLKRDVEKKLEKLDRRTQRAIVEIIRERMAEEAANASSSGEEGSGSSSSGEEESGSSSEDEE